MGRESSQKFINRNRAPRVHIEYEVEKGDATEIVDLPFIMGVMSDLSGKPEKELPPIGERKFVEVDQDNFQSFLKSNKPRVAFQVKNTLSGEGNLNVDLTFESMDDFSPAAVARKVEGLSQLFEKRNELAALLTKIDGKTKDVKALEALMDRAVTPKS